MNTPTVVPCLTLVPGRVVGLLVFDEEAGEGRIVLENDFVQNEPADLKVDVTHDWITQLSQVKGDAHVDWLAWLKRKEAPELRAIDGTGPKANDATEGED